MEAERIVPDRIAPKRIVHVIDDDEAVLAALAFFLDQSGGYAVRPYASGVDFVSGLQTLPAGCVLLDMHMPVMDGLEVLSLLGERRTELPVIVLTGRGDVALAVKAMKAGALDFLEKPYDDDVLLAALHDAFCVLDERAGERSFEETARARVDRLSGRERDVLSGLLAGFPNKIIAYHLGLSTRTVEVYRANLMDKLEARSLSIAVRYALAAGLEPLQPAA